MSKLDNNIFGKFDIMLFAATVILTTVGIIAIYSATIGNSTGIDFYSKQLIFALLGLIFIILIAYIPPRQISNLAYIIYGLSIVLLILVLLFGKTINGNKSWFYIAGFGIQPSEFAKVATVLALANYFSRNEEKKEKFNFIDIIKGTLLVVIPVILIKLQNDTGTTLIMLSFLIPMFYWAGISPFFLFAIVSPAIVGVLSFLNPYYFYAGLILVVIILFIFKRNFFLSALVFLLNVAGGYSVHALYSRLQPYQQNRIKAVFDPFVDPLGSGYNVIQSKVAVGSGGIFGKGFLQGSQTQLKFIPEQWTDFIFCMIGEEFGFIGALFIIILFMILIYRLINNAYLSRNSFLSLSCIGFASLFFFHMFINIGMTIGISPVIGIPLPLLSYGVSSLLSFMFMIGIGMNTYRHKDIFI